MQRWRPGTQDCGGRGGATSLMTNKPRIGVLAHSSHPLLTQAPNFIP